MSKYLVVRIRGWREYDRADGSQQPFSLFPWLRFVPVVLLAALTVWLISLPAVPVVGVVDPVVIGVWAGAGAFAGGMVGTVGVVMATERRG